MTSNTRQSSAQRTIELRPRVPVIREYHFETAVREVGARRYFEEPLDGVEEGHELDRERVACRGGRNGGQG
jgi:hypothetical protein